MMRWFVSVVAKGRSNLAFGETTPAAKEAELALDFLQTAIGLVLEHDPDAPSYSELRKLAQEFLDAQDALERERMVEQGKRVACAIALARSPEYHDLLQKLNVYPAVRIQTLSDVEMETKCLVS